MKNSSRSPSPQSAAVSRENPARPHPSSSPEAVNRDAIIDASRRARQALSKQRRSRSASRGHEEAQPRIICDSAKQCSERATSGDKHHHKELHDELNRLGATNGPQRNEVQRLESATLLSNQVHEYHERKEPAHDSVSPSRKRPRAEMNTYTEDGVLRTPEPQPNIFRP